jgi:membrane protease YdiL (CAAX protease family)
MSKPKKSKPKTVKPGAVTVDLAEQKVNWKEIGTFLALTFALTYLLDLLFLYLAGRGDNAALSLRSFHLQGRMLVPAFCAIALGLFLFKDSPIYFRTFREQPRYFFYFYLVYTLLFLGIGIGTIFIPDETFFKVAMGIAEGATIIGIIFVLRLHFSLGEESLRKVGLSLGKFRYYILFGLLFVALQGAMALLNYLFGLGEAVELTGRTVPWLLVNGSRRILLSAILGAVIAFGEEYAWRGYLQDEFLKLGLLKGLSLVGLVWGLWQVPLVLMGYTYPGHHPLSGVSAVIVYCLALSFILGLIKLKTGGIWLIAFLHSIDNQTWTYLTTMVYRPKDPIFSFGTGIYGLLVLALVAGLFLFFSVRGGEKTAKAEVQS